MKIVPAILTDDPDRLQEMVDRARSFTDWVQIDIMDGRFVPSFSVTVEKLSSVKPAIGWEAHLMVEKPDLTLDHLKTAGASRVIFHYEATSAHREIVSHIKSLGMRAGIAINPGTGPELLEPFLPELDFVLFMSVNPGFYGARFIEGVIDKLKSFKAAHPLIQAGMDGGVKQDNIRLVCESGADCACVGSAIFLSQSPSASYRRLVELAAC